MYVIHPQIMKAHHRMGTLYTLDTLGNEHLLANNNKHCYVQQLYKLHIQTKFCSSEA